MSKKFRKHITGVTRWAGTRHAVMVVSGPDTKVRHFTFPGTAAIGVAALCVVAFGVGAFALFAWSGSQIEKAQINHLRYENVRLYGQIEDMLESVQFLEARMEENGLMEQEFRALANLEAIPEDVLRLGVGGPQPLSELADEASPSFLVRQARETLNRLEELNRKAHFQNANFQEMVTTLQESREEMEHRPSISPVRRGWISSRYGMRKDPFTGRQTMHRGVDFSAWTGTSVYATADGLIRQAGKNGELGLMVEIDHGNGISTRFGHNSRLLVKVGQAVKRGDKIAEVGSTGRSTSPHCHYEIRVNRRDVNPWRYILDGGPSMDGDA
jgi:murein DD-endopeptidase MepM/ murein hydrolase activator NlpD